MFSRSPTIRCSERPGVEAGFRESGGERATTVLRVLPGPGFTFTHNLRDSMQDQKSSDGATRAAQKVCALIQERVGAALDFAKVHGCDVVPTRHDEIAAIIDRETGWIPCAERMPTEKDSDINKLVLVGYPNEFSETTYWGNVVKHPDLYPYWQPLFNPPEE